MLRVIIVYLIIIFISIIVGLSIRLNHTENSNIDLNKETTTESMKCKGAYVHLRKVGKMEVKKGKYFECP